MHVISCFMLQASSSLCLESHLKPRSVIGRTSSTSYYIVRTCEHGISAHRATVEILASGAGRERAKRDVSGSEYERRKAHLRIGDISFDLNRRKCCHDTPVHECARVAPCRVNRDKCQMSKAQVATSPLRAKTDQPQALCSLQDSNGEREGESRKERMTSVR